MRRVQALLADYASYHRTRGNLVCHAFGIPLILFGVASMLRGARRPGARDRAFRIGLTAFAVGWVFQGVGHAYFERNRPAFFKNLAHLWVGPVFLGRELVRRFS